MKKGPSIRVSAMGKIAGAARGIDAPLQRTLAGRNGPAKALYSMLEYFMGFRDEELRHRKGSAGKRFRPGLMLYIADGYGARRNAMNAALAVELFHNFTLIHDDIVDRDEKRRGRATVWKLFGADHAINSGDAQALIASEFCVQAEKEAPGTAHALLSTFIRVCEGQYLDFEMAKRPLRDITQTQYMEMIRRKTAALVGVSAECAGIAAKKSSAEKQRLRFFGESLGLAYQMADDYRSVWSEKAETGKDALGDIREKKRALPAVLAHKKLSLKDRSRLAALYSKKGQMNHAEALETKRLFESAGVREKMRSEVLNYAKKAKWGAEALTLPKRARATLCRAVDELTALA